MKILIFALLHVLALWKDTSETWSVAPLWLRRTKPLRKQLLPPGALLQAVWRATLSKYCVCLANVTLSKSHDTHHVIVQSGKDKILCNQVDLALQAVGLEVTVVLENEKGEASLCSDATQASQQISLQVDDMILQHQHNAVVASRWGHAMVNLAVDGHVTAEVLHLVMQLLAQGCF